MSALTPGLVAKRTQMLAPTSLQRLCDELARFMGTSVEQIDKTYGHLLPDALERTRQALDSFLTEADVKEATP